MTNRDSFEQHDQFTLSCDLLRLLQWLVEHDPEGLKRLITRALAHGLNDKIHQAQQAHTTQEQSDMQLSIIDFFMLMEALLHEAVTEQTVKSALQRNLMPAVHRLDAAAWDNSTVQFSLERATSQLRSNPRGNPKELLVKELIKRWKPNKKNVAN